MPPYIFCGGGCAAARVRKITDKATGEPLVGVSVAVKGTSKGVITNVDGKYTVEVAPDATLLSVTSDTKTFQSMWTAVL